MKRKDNIEFNPIIYPSLEFTDVQSLLWSENACLLHENEFEKNNILWKNKPKSSKNLDGVPNLYKYRIIDPLFPDRTEAIFSDNKLWSPSISNLNDPLEAALSLDTGTYPYEHSSFVMFFQSNWSGCICFTRDPICPQMWAHYSGNHSGFIIEYTFEENFILSAFCMPVMYRREVPKIDIINDPNYLDKIFRTKSEAWEYEREYRLQYPRINSWTKPGLLKPSGIIFGLRTTKKDKDFLRSCGCGLRFGKIEIAKNPYKLKINWDE